MTSNTANTFATGSRTFTVDDLGAYIYAGRVRAVITATGITSSFVEGNISAINTTTPSVTVSVDTTSSGGNAVSGATYSDWSFIVAGSVGVAGPFGSTGTQGYTGSTGAVGYFYGAPSTSAVAMTTGSHTWTITNQSAYINNLWQSYSINNYVYMTPTDGAAGDVMYGTISAISTTTPSVTIDVLQVPQNTGTTRSAWQMSIAGLVGPGSQGIQGVGFNYTTSTSKITYTLAQHRFTVTDSLTIGDGFGFGDRIKLIETTTGLTDYRFMSGYLIAKTGTDFTINVDTIVPTSATNSSATNWRVALTGDVTTQTSQSITFLSTQGATSTSTGALTVAGGVGIGQNVYVGQWLVPMSMTSATAKSYTGTPTGANIFLTGTGYNKPAYWDGTKWYLSGGTALY